jgi:hypothetical protein
MDYDNDQEWKAYYASMMIANSPDLSYSARSASSPSPYGRFGERINDDGGGGGGANRLHEGDDVIGRDVSYEDEERDCGEEAETPTAGGDVDPTTSPSDDPPRGSGAEMMKKKRSGSKRKKRKRRDPNKPKGCLTAVLLYSNANRARVKVENPDSNFGDIVSFLRPPPCRIYPTSR